MAAQVEFTTTVMLGGKTATGIPVPPEAVAALGRGQRVPVVVSIGTYSYRSTIAPYSGQFFLPLAAEHREAAGVAAGDEILVGLTVDDAPREVELPDELADALGRDPAARAAFDALSYSNRRRIALSVSGAKAAETRARRVAKALDELHG